MTELLSKKSKESRYRIEPNITEIDPVIEPLTDLDDDEDAIDRLLINTGFDAEEYMTAHSAVETDGFPVHRDRVPSSDEPLGEDEALAELQASSDDYIEPVDIGSPLVDIGQEPVPSQAAYTNAGPFVDHDNPVSVTGDSEFSALSHPQLEFPSSLNAALPTATDETPELPDLAVLSSAFLEAGQKETSSVYSTASEESQDPFVPEQKPASLPRNFFGGEAAVTDYAMPSAEEFAMNSMDKSKEDALIQEEDLALNALSSAREWKRLISAQEDMRQRIALLEANAQKAGRRPYAATFLAFTALCAALYLGYQNIQMRAELGKLKDMQSIMQEDLSGLNEKLDHGKQGAEDSDETPSGFTGESPLKPESKPATVHAPASPETGPLQAAALPTTGGVRNTSEPPVRTPPILTVKPAKNTALPKSSTYPEKPAVKETSSHWSVNLAAFKQIEDARKKAAEFKQKGIAVKMTKVDIKRTTWYRLSVPGFQTKEAASTHSARLKKLLRLNSIWVAAI